VKCCSQSPCDVECHPVFEPGAFQIRSKKYFLLCWPSKAAFKQEVSILLITTATKARVVGRRSGVLIVAKEEMFLFVIFFTCRFTRWSLPCGVTWLLIAPGETVHYYLSIYGSTALVGPWPLFQFLNLHAVGRTPWTRDQTVARPLHIHKTTETQNKRTQTSITREGFEPTIPVFERAKTVQALERAATVIGSRTLLKGAN
jgi:hypothetical protein